MKGFTLIELLVVIAIIAVLAVVVILTLNPAELLRQSRDSNRFSDLATVNEALGVFSADVSGGSLGSASTTYVSIPDPSATSTAGDQCQGLGLAALPSGWSYHCAASSTYRMVNGTGWIPVNFKSISSGSPVGNLPVDPTNAASTNFYYTYVTDGKTWKETAFLESQKYISKMVSDGGSDSGTYEAGNNLALIAAGRGLIGYWTFDEGSGSTAGDSSGAGNNGTWSGTGSYWAAGKIGTAGQLASLTSDYVSVGNANPLNQDFTNVTIMGWANVSSTQGSDAGMFGKYTTYGMTDHFGTFYVYLNNGGNYISVSASPYSGTWHHFAEVFDGTTMSLYIDGGLATSKISGSPSTGTGVNFNIGFANTVLNGSIDDVRLYNRTLSAAEIQTIYNGQK